MQQCGLGIGTCSAEASCLHWMGMLFAQEGLALCTAEALCLHWRGLPFAQEGLALCRRGLLFAQEGLALYTGGARSCRACDSDTNSRGLFTHMHMPTCTPLTHLYSLTYTPRICAYVDFGISKFMKPGETTDEFMGTPTYMVGVGKTPCDNPLFQLCMLLFPKAETLQSSGS